MSKRLIINADDFGATKKSSENILQCFTSGAVSDVSLLAVGEAFDEAVLFATKAGIKKLGVHLALTESFKPVCPAGIIPTLVNKDGRFQGSYFLFLLKYFTGQIKTSEIYTEFKNQISKVKKQGFTITHLDAHQHMHVVPGILKIVAKLMEEENIKHVRFPREKLSMLTRISDPIGCFRNMMLLFMCRLSAGILEKNNVKHNDYFIGHARALRLKKGDFLGALRDLPEGLTELACHPGVWENELKVLCDKSFIEAVEKHSIKLVSY